jgi:hypothetical protein
MCGTIRFLKDYLAFISHNANPDVAIHMPINSLGEHEIVHLCFVPLIHLKSFIGHMALKFDVSSECSYCENCKTLHGKYTFEHIYTVFIHLS